MNPLDLFAVAVILFFLIAFKFRFEFLHLKLFSFEIYRFRPKPGILAIINIIRGNIAVGKIGAHERGTFIGADNPLGFSQTL